MKKYLFILTLFFTSCQIFQKKSNVSIFRQIQNTDPVYINPINDPLWQFHEATSDQYMITSQGHFASQAGKKMFSLGGNIIDAALAISFTISVERPQSTGIGGGGFLLYYKPGMKNPIALDFREMAPLAAHSKMFLDKTEKIIEGKSTNGIFSVGVPGMVAGLLDLHKQYGHLPLKVILAPAIELAENGFPIYDELASALELQKNELNKYPTTKKIFFKNDNVYQLGDLLKQIDLANSLKLIAQHGKTAFYKGSISRSIVSTSKKMGGLISPADLAQYEVKSREPIHGKYQGYDIYSMPPPSSGGVHVIEILNLLEPLNLKSLGPMNAKSIHYVSQAMQSAFADRAKYLGDPDFYSVPSSGLTNKEYANTLRSSFTENTARKISDVKYGDPFPYESAETTHFSIMTNNGETLVSTQTLNGLFGSGVVVDGTGILLNNEMDDFATKPGASNLYGALGGEGNLVEPKKRPLSSMSPTIVMKDNKPILALGSPSGTRILTCVAQTIINKLTYHLSLKESVSLIRYHHQYSPDYIRVDEPGFPQHVASELQSMGYTLKNENLGCRVQAILNENNSLIGLSDPRGQGLAIGN